MMKYLKKNMMLIALLVVIVLFYGTTGGKILNASNIDSLISQNGYVFALATGMLLCILTGGNIDLSVGSVVCFTGAIGALMMKTYPFPVAVLVMLLAGCAIGAFQGACIAWVSVPPFIATLAGMFAFRGLSNVLLQGYAVDISNDKFLFLFGGGANCYIPDFIGDGTGLNKTCLVCGIAIVVIYIIVSLMNQAKRKKMNIQAENELTEIIKMVLISAVILWLTYKLASSRGIPTVLIWVALILLVYGYITSNTAIGRYFYAVGGNEKATRLSGINTKMVYFIAYVNMGFLAAVAGILTIARLRGIQPTYGQGYEMDAIAACFIGGASASGGVGKVTGVIIGAILMGVINQGMIIMGMDANFKVAVKGLVLLIAVLMDVLSQKNKA